MSGVEGALQVAHDNMVERHVGQPVAELTGLLQTEFAEVTGQVALEYLTGVF